MDFRVDDKALSAAQFLEEQLQKRGLPAYTIEKPRRGNA